ncbi:hypothetical protein [Synechococcus sp. H70.2]
MFEEQAGAGHPKGFLSQAARVSEGAKLLDPQRQKLGNNFL